jgi:peptidoglycan/LPS O-acetylase OafA/YrhL
MAAERLKTIDAARGLAEFWVLAFHALIYLEIGAAAGVIGPCPLPANPANIQPLLGSEDQNWIKPFLRPLMCGNLGVAVFFVVSGFCIHWPAAQAGNAFRFNVGHYVRRRFWRLYPTHFVAVAGSMLIAWLLWRWIEANRLGECVKVPWSAWWAHFFMLQAQIPSTSLYTWCYNPNLWSLETEFQLYACYIILLPIGRRIGWGRLLLFLLPVSLSWHRLMDWHQWGNQYEWPEETCCIGHLFSWTLGAYVAECICRKENPTSILGWSAFIIAAVNTLAVPFQTRPIWFMSGALATAWVLWHLTSRETRRGLTFPGCAWLGWWGSRSYSLYLWHAPILRVFVVIASVRWVRGNYRYAYALAVVAALAALYIARFSYWLVERHFMGPQPTFRLWPFGLKPSPAPLIAEPVRS